MHLIQSSFVSIFISIILMNPSYADTLMYQCKMKNGHFNFTDTPCNKNQKTVESRIIKPIAETHTVTPEYITEETIYAYPRYESNELVDRERRKEADKDRAWNNLGRIGTTIIR